MPRTQIIIAHISRYFQLALTVFKFAEMVRRFLGFGEVPAFHTLILVSARTRIERAAGFYRLARSRSQDAYMQVSRIFPFNDVIINMG